MISINQSQIQQQVKLLMTANWPFPKLTVQMQMLLDSYAQAFAESFESVLSSVKLLNGIVSGGVSVSGGPLIGAELGFAPGSVQAVDFDFASAFVPPVFSFQFSGRTYTGKYTTWLRTLTNIFDSQLKLAWSAWYPLWSLPGFVCVNGGISAWIPPIPPVPPLPGPWSGGSVTVPVSFNLSGQGQSASPSMMELSDATVTDAKSTYITVDIANLGKTTVLMCRNINEEKMIRCITNAFTVTFNEVTSKLTLTASTETVFSGIAYPPTGSVTGSVTELVLV